jgi:hypothetical protein
MLQHQVVEVLAQGLGGGLGQVVGDHQRPLHPEEAHGLQVLVIEGLRVEVRVEELEEGGGHGVLCPVCQSWPRAAPSLRGSLAA